MQSSRRTYFILFLIFLAVFSLKAAASFLMHGPFIFSDEGCVIIKAIHFAEYLQLKPCNELVFSGAGDPFPLYSILISPIYYIFEPSLVAYHAILILNSFLVSTLVFPLYSIYRRFLKNYKVVIFYSTLTVFLSEVMIFEKMLMTECLFIVINIWFLHFYLNSFFENHKRNKLISVFFAILAALTRPFGFILILAMMFNEFTLSKRKRIFSLFAAALSIAIIFIHPNLGSLAYDRVISILDWHNLSLWFKAFINQINSFTVASFAAPLLIFLIHIYEKNSVALNKIRYFLISFIVLNFLISMQHIYGYYTEGLSMDLMTRYINVSLVYIFIFFLIFSTKYKNFSFNFKNAIIISLIFSSLFLLKYSDIKYSQNLDLSVFFSQTDVDKKLSNVNSFFIITFVTSLLLLILFFNHKRKFLILFFSIFTVANTFMAMTWMNKFVKADPPPTFELFKNISPSPTIVFIQKARSDISLTGLFWYNVIFSQNKSYSLANRYSVKGKFTMQFPYKLSDDSYIDVPDIIITDYDMDYLQIGPPFVSMRIYAPKLTIRKEKQLTKY